MTTIIPSSDEHIHPETVWPSRALRISFMAMAVVLVCVGVAIVLIAGEASRTQTNADEQRQANEELRIEIQCRAVPTLEYDKASSKLDALIAEGLGQVAVGAFEDPDAFAAEITAQVAEVRKTLVLREESLTTCAAEGDAHAATTSGD
jgi:hypothetical protein